MIIDVFDFDGTIYDGDSTRDFLLYCLRCHPSLILMLPRLIASSILLALGRRDLAEFKGDIFSYIARRYSLSEEAERFWKEEKTQRKIGEWFRNREKTRPVVIASASPDFELKWAATLLQADLLICTECDESGRVKGRNCKSSEKIERIREKLGEFQVNEMYTDNAKADGPLLALARYGFIVTHGKVQPYRKSEESSL